MAGATIWFTGLSGAGKSTIGDLVEAELKRRGQPVEIMDGDVVRTHLSKGLGFSKEDRDENIRRIGFVCNLLSKHGVFAIAAAISPYRSVRDEVRAGAGGKFLEVYIATPLAECARRDIKGLYAKAFAGEIKNFTGVSDPYEPPLEPELSILTTDETPEQSAQRVIAALEAHGFLSASDDKVAVGSA
jgi:adenylyl-sulfate kinase